MIRLYAHSVTSFLNNGIGALADAISCIVTESKNGTFELEMEYPISGAHYSEIAKKNLVFAKPNPSGDEQPFRIYKISKPLNGIVNINAEHISYDLSGAPIKPFTAERISEAISKIGENAVINTLFSITAAYESDGHLEIKTPTSIRAVMGEMVKVYGGEWEFDGFSCRLVASRGTDRGVSIRYGKNMTELTQDEDASAAYSGVYPYWFNGTLVEIPEKVITITDGNKYAILDLTKEFQAQPTPAELKAKAESYINSHNVTAGTVNLKVSFAQLGDSEEYKNIALLERVDIGDTVSIEYPALGVSASARCIKTSYDALLDRYKSVELGDAVTSIADTIAGASQQAAQASAGVTSFNGRAGAVVPAAGDYNASMVGAVADTLTEDGLFTHTVTVLQDFSFMTANFVVYGFKLKANGNIASGTIIGTAEYPPAKQIGITGIKSHIGTNGNVVLDEAVIANQEWTAYAIYPR